MTLTGGIFTQERFRRGRSPALLLSVEVEHNVALSMQISKESFQRHAHNVAVMDSAARGNLAHLES